MDSWTANRCFDQKEERVGTKVLRDKVKMKDREGG